MIFFCLLFFNIKRANRLHFLIMIVDILWDPVAFCHSAPDFRILTQVKDGLKNREDWALALLRQLVEEKNQSEFKTDLTWGWQNILSIEATAAPTVVRLFSIEECKDSKEEVGE